MPTTSATGRGTAPAAAIPGQDMSLQLSGQTVAWLAKRPHLRELVSSVWDKLADVEQAGDHPGAIAALRFVLVHHQPPTRTGRCRTCRRLSWRRLWRRRPWPCVVWRQVRVELLGYLAVGGCHRRGPDQGQTLFPSSGRGPGL
jgi:hypothetical protein